MASEIDFQTAARHIQDTLLAEASARRLARSSYERPDEPVPTRRRLQTLLRRLAGSPSFG